MSEKGCLDKSAYCGYVDEHKDSYKRVRRTQSTSAEQREAIYQLFEIYTRMKRGRNEYDAADRCAAALSLVRWRTAHRALIGPGC